MEDFYTPAIILRRISYGDYDLILKLLTPDHGKVSVFARSARKDARRHSGALEPFSILRASIRAGRGRLLTLAETSLVDPLASLRTNVLKTAYASYWSELIDTESEEGAPSPDIYPLLHESLTALDGDRIGKTILHLLFQLKFARLSGFFPGLTSCRSCKTSIDCLCQKEAAVDIASGTMVCGDCAARNDRPLRTSMGRSYGDRLSSGQFSVGQFSVGTIKTLLWLEKTEMSNVSRIRIPPDAIEECIRFLEAFIPHHLGHCLRSLAFLEHIRKRREEGRMYHVG